MALNKKKKSKKDELKGAMDGELSSNGIMGEFVNNVKNDKSNSGKSEESGGFLESIKSIAQMGQKTQKDKGDSGGNFPMIRNRSQKESWVSLGAFLAVIFLVLLIFFAIGGGNKYQVYLSSTPVDNYMYGAAETKETFESGKPVYVYFAAKKAIKTGKIFIEVINLNRSSAEGKLSTIESNINPEWKIVETHFQKEYFETPGKYKIIIENEKKKVLVDKIFTIK
jgi:hypothetical protein